MFCGGLHLLVGSAVVVFRFLSNLTNKATINSKLEQVFATTNIVPGRGQVSWPKAGGNVRAIAI
jgi:hypothetical protein